MNLWWSRTAERQYLKYYHDVPVRKSFDELLNWLENSPGVGTELGKLEPARDPWERRVLDALHDAGLLSRARIITCTVTSHVQPNPPLPLSALIFLEGAPADIDATYSLLTMGVIYRQGFFS